MNRYIDAEAIAYIVASNGDADFINKVTKLMIDAPSIDLADYVPKDFHDKTCEAMAKAHQEEILKLMADRKTEPQTEDAYAYDEDDWYDKTEREGE